MKSSISIVLISLLLVCFCMQSCSQAAKDVQRPEKIVSKRIVVYDADTYKELAKLWKEYYDVFPSEDAYANWMYAARYAGDPDYEKLLEKGYKKYPANPTILYLYGMQEYGCHDNMEGLHVMEKAARLDPTYMDVWFGLVGYYMDTDEEKLDQALRKLLEGGAIPDELMDYNYNKLAGLEKNAILITNGDMDTYPGWILQRILEFRTDVNIINRSLLNTDWYPMMVIKEGASRFITQSDLEDLRSQPFDKDKLHPAAGPYGDVLIEKIIQAATREGRPVYFAATLYHTDTIKQYWDKGQQLGLATLVNPGARAYGTQVRKLMKTWLEDFRTAGLDNWSFRQSPAKMASRNIALNYAFGLNTMMDEIVKSAPQYRLDLFGWYTSHMQELIPQKYVDEVGKMWCSSDDIGEIRDWCRKQGYLE